jgi:hypothetical protein
VKKLIILIFLVILASYLVSADWIPAACGDLDPDRTSTENSQQDCHDFCAGECASVYSAACCPNFDWNSQTEACTCFNCFHCCGTGDNDPNIRCSVNSPGPGFVRYQYGDPGCAEPQGCWFKSTGLPQNLTIGHMS